MATESRKKTIVKGVKPEPAALSYDKEKEFEETISPILEKLTHACLANRIPFFCSFCTKNDKKKSEYISEGVSPETLDIQLADNFFDRMLMVVNGFDTIPRDIEEGEDDSPSDRAAKMMTE